MAWEWLAPILTPAALRSVQADASPLATTLLCIIGLIVEGGICWWIAYATRTPEMIKAAAEKKKNSKGMFAFLKK